MIDFPREVRAGDRVSATEFNRVVRLLRRLCPLQGPGVRLSEGPNGTVISVDAKTVAGSIVVKPQLPTVYEIVTDTSGSGGTERKHFTSRYYELSGILRDGPDIPSGSSLDSSTYKGKFVALVVQGLSNSISAAITPYATLELLRAAQAVKTQLVMPLYKFDSTGAVEIDFRHIPRADAWSLGS